MIGKHLGHYRVLEKIGEGGMGEVYRAQDTRLGRDVALKVLPKDMASDPERLSRFKREAKAVAALNHPNIVTIHSVEEVDATPFLTMELVEGTPLDVLLGEEGLPLERFFSVAIPIADAVAGAHDRGIIHRDLKPANVVVTTDGDRVKVLDFGLAKRSERRELEGGQSEIATVSKTADGLVVGTPHYMSPEQARGGTVDHRSDVFSLGVVFFEMASGRRPFEGANAVEAISSVLKDAAPDLSETRPDIPRHLARIVGRCLEKAPHDRYQSAREILGELHALKKELARASDSSLRRAAPQAPWIAILPFECRNADPELESFASGLTDDITTGLSRFSYLLVVSRNTTRKFEGDSRDVRRVGQELGARYAIEGSLRRGGARVRLSVQLVDTQTGTHVWAEAFDRNLGEADIFDLQDEITDRVVATIADPYGVLARSMVAPVATKPPEDLTPNESVLRWFLYNQRLSAEEHLLTRSALERAVGARAGQRRCVGGARFANLG